MPLYDCTCPECGFKAEQILNREEEPEKCKNCHGPMKRDDVQLPNFALKGGGWFADGYSKGSGGKS